MSNMLKIVFAVAGSLLVTGKGIEARPRSSVCLSTARCARQHVHAQVAHARTRLRRIFVVFMGAEGARSSSAHPQGHWLSQCAAAAHTPGGQAGRTRS